MIHSNNVDILLISLREENIKDHRTSIPLTLPYLKAIIEKHNFSIKCIFGETQSLNYTDIQNLLKKYAPKVVGLSGTAYEEKTLIRITRQIKSISIKIPVIIGGFCSLLPDLAEKTKADAVCVGEGDQTIIELLEYFIHNISEKNSQGEIKNLTTKNPLTTIKGINFWDTINETIIITENRDLIENLNSLPMPDFSEMDFSKFMQGEPAIPLYVQRGCYNNCNFCDVQPFYKKQVIRSTSPKIFVPWIKLLYEKYNTSTIIINDDNFMSYKWFLEELIDEFNKHDLVGKVKLNFQTRVNDILRFEELLEPLKPIIYSIELGIESFSNSQLKRFNKNITREQNLKAIQILIEKNIPFCNYYMFFDGHTTIEELKENILTILDLPSVPHFSHPSFIPEIVFNFEYNVLNDVKGNSSIEDKPFLKYSNMYLNKTEKIQTLFSLYWSLQTLNIQNEKDNINNSHLSSFQISFIEGLKEKIMPQIVDLARERLKNSLEIAKKINNSPAWKKYNIKKNIKIQIDDFIRKYDEILRPLMHIGLDPKDFSSY